MLQGGLWLDRDSRGSTGNASGGSGGSGRKAGSVGSEGAAAEELARGRRETIHAARTTPPARITLASTMASGIANMVASEWHGDSPPLIQHVDAIRQRDPSRQQLGDRADDPLFIEVAFRIVVSAHNQDATVMSAPYHQ